MSKKERSASWIIISAVFLSMVFVGCAGQKQLTKAEMESLKPSGQVQNGVRIVQVQAKRFEFIPSQIIVRAGEQVRLEVTSLDGTHGITIPAFNLSRDLISGKTEVITLSTNAEGTYPFHCSVFCGLGHGDMHGQLVVLPSDK